MYTQFFRLTQAPFSISPDPRYLFMSERHREALAHLLYGIDSGGGIVLLTGDIGTGKTTICRCFLEQVPENCNVAYIFNPKLTVTELLQSVCEEFHVPLPETTHQGSVKDYIDALNHYLLDAYAQGRNNVLIIDEAQNLSVDVLEQLRLLTNLETNERKLLQIILIGQPELRTILERPDLEQLAQRVIAHYHLTALTERETANYIQHRLATAGLNTASPFQPHLIKYIHRLTRGVPRRINLLCDRALLGAYAKGKPLVDREILKGAALELFKKSKAIKKRRQARQQWPFAAMVLLGGALLIGGAAWIQMDASPIRPGSGWTGLFTWSDAKPGNSTGQAGQVPTAASATSSTSSTSGEQTASHEGWGDEDDAIRELAKLWGSSLTGDAPCLDAVDRGLRCHRSTSGIAELRRLDRPAVLKLRNESGIPHYVLLTRLDGGNAVLTANGKYQTVGLYALVRQYTGEFVTLWRMPPGFDGTFKMNDKGPGVDWVAVQLARLEGSEPPPAEQPYDQSMARQVRVFQQAHGLLADGIVGPVTAMYINRAVGLDEPRLFADARANSIPE